MKLTEETLLNGERLSDGSCRITHEGRIPANEEMAAIEVAYDPGTCRSLVEIGTWKGDDELITGEGNRGKTDREHAEQSADARATGRRVRSAASTRKRAYTWAWYDDPLRWTEEDVEDEGVIPPVNWVRTDVTWEPDGTCVVPTGAYGATDLYDYYLSETGWSRVSRRWGQPLQQGASGYCGGPIYSKGFLHYRNVPFCVALTAPLPYLPPDPRGPTNTYYEPTAVEGYKDGTARFYWQATRKEGGCNELLRMGKRFGYTTTGPFGGP